MIYLPSVFISNEILQPLQFPLANIGVEARIFEVLSEADGSTSSNAELAKKTGVDTDLMSRIDLISVSYAI
jgi:hypothetical protein